MSATKYAKIAASSSGNNTIVAAVAGKRIKVLGFWMISDGDVDVKFQSGAGGTDLTGLIYMPSSGAGVSVPVSDQGVMPLTEPGALLNLNLSGATAVGGAVTYKEVD